MMLHISFPIFCLALSLLVSASECPKGRTLIRGAASLLPAASTSSDYPALPSTATPMTGVNLVSFLRDKKKAVYPTPLSTDPPSFPYRGNPRVRRPAPPPCRYVFDGYEGPPEEVGTGARSAACPFSYNATKGNVSASVSSSPPSATTCQISDEDLAQSSMIMQKENEAAFGIMHYKLVCSTDRKRSNLPQRHRTLIEPLSCHHRDTLWMDEWSLKMNMRLLYDAGHHTPRYFYFDVGAGLWLDPDSSQMWFVKNVFESMCVEMDGGMFVWEPSRRAYEKQILRRLPPDLKLRYHLFHEHAVASRTSWDNPLNHILSRTTPDDYVILKINSGQQFQDDVVRTIVGTPSLLARIDEVFVAKDVESQDSGSNYNYDKGMLGMMNVLREYGIRAHFWGA
eukprot:PhM_4_TR16190/c0_g1_i1/m.68858